MGLGLETALSYKKLKGREFPGGPVVRTPHFHCQAQVQSLVGGRGSGTKIQGAVRWGQKKKKKVGREPWRQGVSLWLLPCLDEATWGFILFLQTEEWALWTTLFCLNIVGGGKFLVKRGWNGQVWEATAIFAFGYPQVQVQPSVLPNWSQSLRQVTTQFVAFKTQLYAQRFMSPILANTLLAEVLCQNTQLCAWIVHSHIFRAFHGPGPMLKIWVCPHINSLDCEYHPAK